MFAPAARVVVASRVFPHFGGKLPAFRVMKTYLSGGVQFWAWLLIFPFWLLFHVEHFPF